MKQEEVYYKVLPSPPKPDHLFVEAKWLSGEGCGSWFNMEENEGKYLVSRFNSEGKLECRGTFKQVLGRKINLKKEFEFTYMSHCAEITIIQANQMLSFKLVRKC